jgi:hypothetical protein
MASSTISSEPTSSSEPRSPAVVWTLILASIGAFITSLDVVVVSTALPTLQRHLRASLSDLEWTSTPITWPSPASC